MTLAKLAKAVERGQLLNWCLVHAAKCTPDEAVARLWKRSTLYQRVRFGEALKLPNAPWTIAYSGPLASVSTEPRDVVGYRVVYGSPRFSGDVSDGGMIVELYARGIGTVEARFGKNGAPWWRLVDCPPPRFETLIELARAR